MRSLLSPTVKGSRKLLANEDGGAESALPPLFETLTTSTDWARVDQAVDGDVISAQGVTRLQKAPLAFADVLTTACFGDNPLTIDMCQSRLKRGPLVNAITKCSTQNGMRIKV